MIITKTCSLYIILLSKCILWCHIHFLPFNNNYNIQANSVTFAANILSFQDDFLWDRIYLGALTKWLGWKRYHCGPTKSRILYMARPTIYTQSVIIHRLVYCGWRPMSFDNCYFTVAFSSHWDLTFIETADAQKWFIYAHTLCWLVYASSCLPLMYQSWR